MGPFMGRPLVGAELSNTIAAAAVARFSPYLSVSAPFVERRSTPGCSSSSRVSTPDYVLLGGMRPLANF
jgi:hypothetical protein